MEETVFGVILTIIMPFAVLIIATAVRKLGVSGEGARKLVHILLSNWILLALAVYHNALACLMPACFVILNIISYKKNIFSAIEREEDNTLGTVWYAVSLFLLCLIGSGVGMPWIAACGMLAMGYGDGLAALIGKRFGRFYFPGVHSKKSLEGFLIVMLFSGVSVWGVCTFYAADVFHNFPVYAALSCAVPAAALELLSPSGTDNLTLPIGVGLIVLALAWNPSSWQFFACLSITLLVLITAYYLCAITLQGLAVALLLGIILFLTGGWLCFTALVVFFILGSMVSRFGKKRKASAADLHEREGARSTAQVLANGLPALIFAVLYCASGRKSCLLAVFACFASTAADTFASEVGMLSAREPVSILTWKKVQRGMSGGVTLLGVLGSAIGACFISVLAIPDFGIFGMLICVLTGIGSALLDSVFGEAFQAKYQMKQKEGKTGMSMTERRTIDGEALELAKGIKWVNNDVVNFVSVFICGMLVAILVQNIG